MLKLWEIEAVVKWAEIVVVNLKAKRSGSVIRMMVEEDFMVEITRLCDLEIRWCEVDKRKTDND